MFRVDIGFDEERGYGAVLYDVQNERQKGIRANSMQQLTSRLRNVLNEEAAKRKQFPAEQERSTIITPDQFNGT